MANFSDSTPAAAAGGVNVKWQKDSGGNISAYYSTAGAQTPWTQDIDAAGFKLNNTSRVGIKASTSTSGADVFYFGSGGVQRWQSGLMPDDQGFSVARCNDSGVAIERVIEGNRSTGAVTIRSLVTPGNIQSSINNVGHSFNLSWDGSNFRYVEDGTGYVIRHDGFLRIYGASTGVAGAVATLQPHVMLVQPTGINFGGAGINVMPSTTGAAYPFQYIGQGGNIQWVVSMTSDATDNDFSFARRNAGVPVDTPLLLSRSTGNLTLAKYLVLTTRTAAADDVAAATAGVPVGGLYHNAGAVRIRLA